MRARSPRPKPLQLGSPHGSGLPRSSESRPGAGSAPLLPSITLRAPLCQRRSAPQAPLRPFGPTMRPWGCTKRGIILCGPRLATPRRLRADLPATTLVAPLPTSARPSLPGSVRMACGTRKLRVARRRWSRGMATALQPQAASVSGTIRGRPSARLQHPRLCWGTASATLAARSTLAARPQILHAAMTADGCAYPPPSPRRCTHLVATALATTRPRPTVSSPRSTTRSSRHRGRNPGRRCRMAFGRVPPPL
mmetsp:Transcript_73715/g.205034  ORF Transcript_73715/g.205034 Transcript_73715/m.205034 type:complete len:251 (-) Transcript_73715:96-848(-)